MADARPLPRTPARTRRRRAILDAAEALFGAHGFHKTTLEDVAVSAAVSRPLIYRYFRDKEDLYAEVIDRVLREWFEVLQAEAARATPGTAHTLRLILTTCLDFARSRSVLRGLLARDSRIVLAGHSDVIERSSEMLRELLREVLVGGQRRRDVRTDLAVEDVAHVVSEIFIAYSDHVIAGDAEGLGERRVTAIVETLLHGVIAQPGAFGASERDGR